MQNTNPRRLSLLTAFVLSVVLVLLVLLVLYVLPSYFSRPSILSSGPPAFWPLLLLAGLFFTSAYFLVLYMLNTFIISRIRVIYKTIRRQKGTLEVARKAGVSGDALDKAGQEAEEWSKQQLEEIEKLKMLEQYRRDFIGNVSHELKTPVFNIQGYVLTLLDGGLEDPEINRTYLERTEKSVNRLISIVEDLDKISRLESGQLKMEYCRFELQTLTREVMELLESKAADRNIAMQFGGEYEKGIFVWADREKIRQVMTNLIDNSLKYGKKEGKTKVSFFDMDDHYLVEVTDNGIGVDTKDIPRLFERFYRTDKARSRDSGGTGLGLAIVKHIVEAHGQNLHVRSTVGVGTTFAFTLKKAS